MQQKPFDWRDAWRQYLASARQNERAGRVQPLAMPEFVHWRELLADLKATGLRDRDVAETCGLRVGYVAQLRRPSSIGAPIYEKGAALLNLWLKVCLSADLVD